MESKEKTPNGEISVQLSFSPKAEKECYVSIRGKLVKLLYIIEEEEKGNGEADKFLFSFVTELLGNNDLCDSKLTTVVSKIYGLSKNNRYKTMTHDQIKRLVFEARGIVDHLIEEMSN